jgi:GMP synthase (glutamine-hydrolysing)
MGVYEADRFPHVHHEIRFAEQRIASGKPILGVCLGAQIIAKALGSKVYKGPQGKEIGWNPVSINAEGMRTPLKYLDQSECTVAHWHGDTFDLPQGAKLLASSDKYQNQAYAYGDMTLGLQFHPEVTEVKFDRWYTHLLDDILEAGKTVDDMRRDAHLYADILKTQNRLFFNEWLELVTPHLVEKRHQPLVETA